MDQPGKNRMLDVHLSRVCAFPREEEEDKRELISQKGGLLLSQEVAVFLYVLTYIGNDNR